MELFKAITIVKSNKGLAKTLIKSGVLSANIFTEHEIYQRILKMKSKGKKKTDCVEEMAKEYRITPRYVWKILKRFKDEY